MAEFTFPSISPVAFSIAGFDIYWYGIAYVAGILLAWLYCRHLITRVSHHIKRQDIDDFIIWAALGVVLGGRLGWVLFYMPEGYFQHFWEVLYLWRPGMSFHGGLIGVAIVTLIYCYKRSLPIFAFSDLLASAAPIGLFFGRLANFVNGELYGRVTDVSWGMAFPSGGPFLRHPSQLYEAALEGVVLFLAILAIERFTHLRKNHPGFIFSFFLVGYGLSRFIVEAFREPDSHIGYLIFNTTMGQLLSLPIIFIGFLLMWISFKKHRKKT